MKKFNTVLTIFLLVLLLAISGCQNSTSNVSDNVNQVQTVATLETTSNVSIEPEEPLIFFEKTFASDLNQYESELYDITVSKALEQDLWSSRDIYDSVHMLLVPLWYAFESGNEKYIEEFSNHYKDFLLYIDSNESSFAENSGLYKNHYLYLASEYMLLCEIYGYEEYIPTGLYDFIEDYIIDYYFNYKASWGRAVGIPEMLTKILSGEAIYVKNSTKSYYRAITDNETFPLAIMADLYTIQKISGLYNDHTPTYKEAMDYTCRLCKAEVEWNSAGGWTLQPGVMSDYPDYAYAGVETIDENTLESPVDDIAVDTSHFKRFAPFLNSYMRAQDTDECAGYFDQLIDGMAMQILEFVLVRPDETTPFYRTTNYMDGTNGYFRYGYHEDGVGYGPYQLSKSMLQGWWTFLRNKEISKMYKEIGGQFPLSDEGKLVYLDPVTVRERNDIYASWEILELTCILAAKI